ncbi:MAG: DUF4349 domain-containing protein [Thermincolia bacterium]
MNCEEMKELLSCYIDGVLEDKEMKDVENHLEQCPYCQQELADLKAALGLIHQGGEVQPPEGFRARVMEKIEALPGDKEVGSRWKRISAHFNGGSPWFKLRAAAAVVAIGIGLSLGVASFSPSIDIAQQMNPKSNGLIAFDGMTNAVESSLDNVRSAQSAPINEEAAVVAKQAIVPKKKANSMAERKIIKNASVRLEVTNIMEVNGKITTKVEALGGFVENSTISAEDSANLTQPEQPSTGEVHRGSLIVRVPVERFDEMFSHLKGLGTVVFENRSGQDVTGQYQDTQTRIRNLKRHEDRLLTLLDEAKNLDETLRVENELRRIREEVELREGELKLLTDQTDLATLHVELIEVKSGTKITSPEPKTVIQKAVRAFVSNTNSLLDFLGASIVFVGGALPFMGVVAVLGGIGWYLRRLRKK